MRSPAAAAAARPAQPRRGGGLFDFFGGGREEEEQLPQTPIYRSIDPNGRYRSVCVRLCDGFFYPIHYSTYGSLLGQDAQQCQSNCAAPAELYVYRNPGQEIEQAVSLNGSAYMDLPVALRFRKEYVKGCSCKQAEYNPTEIEASNKKAEVDADRQNPAKASPPRRPRPRPKRPRPRKLPHLPATKRLTSTSPAATSRRLRRRLKRRRPLSRRSNSRLRRRQSKKPRRHRRRLPLRHLPPRSTPPRRRRLRLRRPPLRRRPRPRRPATPPAQSTVAKRKTAAAAATGLRFRPSILKLTRACLRAGPPPARARSTAKDA